MEAAPTSAVASAVDHALAHTDARVTAGGLDAPTPPSVAQLQRLTDPFAALHGAEEVCDETYRQAVACLGRLRDANKNLVRNSFPDKRHGFEVALDRAWDEWRCFKLCDDSGAWRHAVAFYGRWTDEPEPLARTRERACDVPL